MLVVKLVAFTSIVLFITGVYATLYHLACVSNSHPYGRDCTVRLDLGYVNIYTSFDNFDILVIFSCFVVFVVSCLVYFKNIIVFHLLDSLYFYIFLELFHLFLRISVWLYRNGIQYRNYSFEAELELVG